MPSGVRGAGPSRFTLPSVRRGPVVRTPFHCAEADAAAINTATAVAMAILLWGVCIIIILWKPARIVVVVQAFQACRNRRTYI